MYLSNKRVGVKVERFGKQREHKYKISEQEIIIVKEGTAIIPLEQISDKAQVYSIDGAELIEPTGRFYITAETIDPYHIILDIF